MRADLLRVVKVPPALARYIFSHYLYNGVTVALGAALVTFAAFYLLGAGAGLRVAIGAICVSFCHVSNRLPDLLRNLTLAAIGGTLVTLLVGFCKSSPPLMFIAVVLTSFGAAMLVAYGKQFFPTSFSLIFAMILLLGTPVTSRHTVWHLAAWFLVGGVAYGMYALAISALLAYRTRQQVLAEALYELALYLRAKADFYDSTVNLQGAYQAMIRTQTSMAEKLQTARDFVFRDIRRPRDARLAAALFKALDIYEGILSSNSDYALIRRHFPASAVLARMRALALLCAGDLEGLALDLMRDRRDATPAAFDVAVAEVHLALEGLQVEVQGADPVNQEAVYALALLRGLSFKVGEIAAALLELHRIAGGAAQADDLLPEEELEPFLTGIDLRLRLLRENCSLQSPPFRYALRLAAAMAMGYFLAEVLPYAAHGQWILLTIAVVIRPNFSQTMQRHKDRLIGNAIGCVIAALLLHFVTFTPALVATIFVCLAIAHGSVMIRYRYTAIAAAVMGLLQMHFLDPGLQFAVAERLIDTVVGATVAYAFSFVLPNWERRNLPNLLRALLKVSAAYAAQALTPRPRDLSYRLARKQVLDAVNNLAAAMARMLDEPRERRVEILHLNFLIVQSYLFAAHLASLRVLLRRRAAELDVPRATAMLEHSRDAVQALFAPAPADASPSVEDRVEAGVESDVDADTSAPGIGLDMLRMRLTRIGVEARELRTLIARSQAELG